MPHGKKRIPNLAAARARRKQVAHDKAQRKREKAQAAWEKRHPEIVSRRLALEEKVQRDERERNAHVKHLTPEKKQKIVGAADAKRSYRYGWDCWDCSACNGPEGEFTLARGMLSTTTVRELVLNHLTSIPQYDSHHNLIGFGHIDGFEAPAWFEACTTSANSSSFDCWKENVMRRFPADLETWRTWNVYDSGASIFFHFSPTKWPELEWEEERVKTLLKGTKQELEWTNTELERVEGFVMNESYFDPRCELQTFRDFHALTKSPESRALLEYVEITSSYTPPLKPGDISKGQETDLVMDEDGSDSEDESTPLDPRRLRNLWWACDHDLTLTQRAKWWGLDEAILRYTQKQPVYTRAKAVLVANFGSVQHAKGIPQALRKGHARLQKKYNRLRKILYDGPSMLLTNELLRSMRDNISDPSKFVDDWTKHLGLVNTFLRRDNFEAELREEQLYASEECEGRSVENYRRASFADPTQFIVMTARHVYEASGKTDADRTAYEEALVLVLKRKAEVKQEFDDTHRDAVDFENPESGPLMDHWWFKHDGVYEPEEPMTVGEAHVADVW